MLKGIIFDLDGTLIDSMTAWDNVGRDLLISYGVTPPEGLDDQLKVMSFTQSSRFFVEEFHLPMTVEEAMAHLYRVVSHRYQDLVPEKKSAKALLALLQEKGIRCCVATATSPDLANAALSRLGLLPYLDFVLTCDELGIGKDSPDVYHHATERLGFSQSEVVIVEDALHCVETAKKADYRVVGVYDASSHAEQEQIKALCDLYAESFDPPEVFLRRVTELF